MTRVGMIIVVSVALLALGGRDIRAEGEVPAKECVSRTEDGYKATERGLRCGYWNGSSAPEDCLEGRAGNCIHQDSRVYSAAVIPVLSFLLEAVGCYVKPEAICFAKTGLSAVNAGHNILKLVAAESCPDVRSPETGQPQPAKLVPITLAVRNLAKLSRVRDIRTCRCKAVMLAKGFFDSNVDCGGPVYETAPDKSVIRRYPTSSSSQFGFPDENCSDWQRSECQEACRSWCDDRLNGCVSNPDDYYARCYAAPWHYTTPQPKTEFYEEKTLHVDDYMCQDEWDDCDQDSSRPGYVVGSGCGSGSGSGS